MSKAQSLEELYEGLSPDERQEIDAMIAKDFQEAPWRPLIDLGNPDKPTPQQQAYDSKADPVLWRGCWWW